MSANATWLEDKAASIGMSGQALSAGILGALVLAILLLRSARPAGLAAAVSSPALKEVKEKEEEEEEKETPEPRPEIQSLDGFDWTTAERNEFRPFKPIYHITMGASSSAFSTSSHLLIFSSSHLLFIHLPFFPLRFVSLPPCRATPPPAQAAHPCDLPGIYPGLGESREPCCLQMAELYRSSPLHPCHRPDRRAAQKLGMA